MTKTFTTVVSHRIVNPALPVIIRLGATFDWIKASSAAGFQLVVVDTADVYPVWARDLGLGNAEKGLKAPQRNCLRISPQYDSSYLRGRQGR